MRTHEIISAHDYTLNRLRMVESPLCVGGYFFGSSVKGVSHASFVHVPSLA